MRKVLLGMALLLGTGTASKVLALGVEMQGGVGVASFKPSKPADVSAAVDSANAFCGEGSLGLRVNRRLSGGLSLAWSLEKFDLASDLGGNWQYTQALVSGNIYGQYNFLTGRLRPYIRAEVGTFSQVVTVIDTTTNTGLAAVGESGLHYSGSLGGELGFTRRFYGFLQAEYQGFQFKAEPANQFGAQIGIGYTFANVFDF